MAAGKTGKYPTLVNLLHDGTKVDELPAEIIPPMLSQLSALQGALAARLATLISTTSASAQANQDRLLAIEEAAKILSVSDDWIYHHDHDVESLPFIVRLGRQVRFSAQGIQRYIREQLDRQKTVGMQPSRGKNRTSAGTGLSNQSVSRKSRQNHR